MKTCLFKININKSVPSQLTLHYPSSWSLQVERDKKKRVKKTWSQELVAANQFISSRSQNEVVANNSWFTLMKVTTVNHVLCVCSKYMICENLEQLLMGSQIFIMHGSKSISRDKRYYCLLSVAWGNL